MADQEVPLVAYVNGGRVEIGTAVVHDDGTIDATLDDQKITPETRRMFMWAGDVSLGVTPAHVKKPSCPMHGCKLHHAEQA